VRAPKLCPKPCHAQIPTSAASITKGSKAPRAPGRP
jgi:hypothetical protein